MNKLTKNVCQPFSKKEEKGEEREIERERERERGDREREWDKGVEMRKLAFVLEFCQISCKYSNMISKFMLYFNINIQ